MGRGAGDSMDEPSFEPTIEEQHSSGCHPPLHALLPNARRVAGKHDAELLTCLLALVGLPR